MVRKSVSKDKHSEDSGNNMSWLGSKENLGNSSHSKNVPQCRIDMSRYAAKSKNSTPLDSHRTNKVSNNSLEVREFDRIPTIVDRFDKRREASDMMMSQLSKYDINNDRINSFRNKCKEYDNKLSSSRPLIDDINATRKMTAPNPDHDLSDIKIAQNLSRTKMRNSSNEVHPNKDLNISDLQFLFSKKLSNVEKLSLLKLKKKEESTSSRLRDEPAPNLRESFLNDKSTSNLHLVELKSSARGVQARSHLRDSQKSYSRESSAQIRSLLAKNPPANPSSSTKSRRKTETSKSWSRNPPSSTKKTRTKRSATSRADSKASAARCPKKTTRRRWRESSTSTST